MNDENNKEIELYGPFYFFKQNYNKYPILTYCAKAILACPITSVPSEQLFSQVGLIQTELRNRLNPFLLNMLTVIKENKFNF